MLLLCYCILHPSLSLATAAGSDLRPTAPSNRLPLLPLCRCILWLFSSINSHSQPLPLSLPRSRGPLPLLDSTLPHLPVAPTALLAGVYSSTSVGPSSSTPTTAPSLCTSPLATEAKQPQLFSHLFFAIK
ncbi:hypothetical protein B296_00050946 [Ensete ventricosum]|uniref:Uncharacterized protein n=1 Tax=Ensete ventricosum TaxID=4639 RepID=A0A426Y7C7_ENSVE|nr:hypothetical protein B296_00050946 [Ensete ventricosum]